MKLVFYCMLFAFVRGQCTSETVIETYVSELAPGSDIWLDMVQNVSVDFPDISFSTKSATPEDIGRGMMLPASIGTFNGVRHTFDYKMNEIFFRRWLRDGTCGHFSLFETTSMLDSFMNRNYPVFVHILSEEKPKITLVKKLPSVGVFWSHSNISTARNMLIVRDVLGHVHQLRDFSVRWLLHILLPPVIPIKMFDDAVVSEIYGVLAKNEIMITSDAPLGVWWKNVSDGNTNTGLVLYKCNETSLPCSSVTLYRGSILYRHNTTDESVIPWLKGIGNNETQPTFRLSTVPEQKHPEIDDVTGDSMWDWLSQSNRSFLYLYGSEDDDTIWPHIGNIFGQMGRMDINKNAHEVLPVNAAAGLCFVFEGKKVRQMNLCQHFLSIPKPVEDERGDEVEDERGDEL